MIQKIVFVVTLTAVLAALAEGKSRRRVNIRNGRWEIVDGRYVIHMDGTKSGVESYLWEVKNDEGRYESVGDSASLEYKTDSPGIYRFKLTVTIPNYVNPQGEQHSRTTRIRIPQNKAPVAVGLMGMASIGTSYWMFLNGRNSSDDAGIDSYKWTMIQGDELGLTVDEAEHTYRSSNPGIYQWELTVCDGLGVCSSQLTQDFNFRWVPPPMVERGRPDSPRRHRPVQAPEIAP